MDGQLGHLVLASKDLGIFFTRTRFLSEASDGSVAVRLERGSTPNRRLICNSLTSSR
ncbi:hypothetical protein RvY_18524 [Ramazzottius varieornatus]|uniref:Uncharacterized protein n=1 Tax=Ramazzottius varieornatus TaxID=947166 RepID=A0A1D1W9B5_RAMVA|nr:hypothetical protein RvY_18524 [Ramazzottius varieornatus]